MASIAIGYHRLEERRWAGAVARLKTVKVGRPIWTASVLEALQRPCCDEKGCEESAARKCPAHRNSAVPCWAMREIAEGARPSECYTCDRFIKTRQLQEMI